MLVATAYVKWVMRYDVDYNRWREAKSLNMRQANEAALPLVLEKRDKIFTADGGHRSCLPEDTLREYAHLVGSTGIIDELERVHQDPLDLLHVYVARLRTTFANQPGLEKALRSPSVGKGMTSSQARASALGEAVERYSGIFRGDECRIKATYRALGNDAIHPNACMNFSTRQYRERDKWNRIEAEYNWVPEPFDEERPIEWTPAWSLTEERFKHVVTASCYFGYPVSAEHDFCRPDSNGNAAGNSLEEAILHGFLELVERDSVALWWYNQVRRRQVDLGSFGEFYFQAIGEIYRMLGRPVHVFDTSSDFPIPSFAAVSSDKEGELLFGFGTHLEPRIAIARALTEMNQSLGLALRGEKPRFFVGGPLQHAFLSPPPLSAFKTQDDYSRLDSKDLWQDLRTCVMMAQERGMETLVVDQTRPDVGMPVVKVIVPGMRPWWARFATGRLYDVPVQMGWQGERVREEQLNSCHLTV